MVEIGINLEKVCFIIIKAREFDAKVEPIEPDPGSNPADSGMSEILEDYADDPTVLELRSAIEELNEDELAELLALIWVGRGDYEAAEWKTALATARATRNKRATDYLIGTPQLGDLLEEGLSALGRSCEDIEMGRL